MNERERQRQKEGERKKEGEGEEERERERERERENVGSQSHATHRSKHYNQQRLRSDYYSFTFGFMRFVKKNDHCMVQNS